MGDPWTDVGVVETYTGRQFDVFDPVAEAVDLDDIAAGLAHTCRFGGHCQHFYSVAHHSLHVSRELPEDEPRLQLLGLFHDAAEAYVGDVPRPLKARYDVFERVEAEVLDAIWRALDVDPPDETEWERVMTADDRLLAYEAGNVLEDGSWAGEPPDLAYELRSDSIETIRTQFLSRSETLRDRV
ncbi:MULTISPECIES: HD domain-containing protein [Salinibaculum]|uniref:HD domain-containing protein n=1 Tax=Salinibaculum TaxID=2732368 RepID=UPI0030D021C3